NDNPTPNSPVWATGLRNTFGVAWHPTQPWLFSTENGDQVGDEVNRISVNSNLGWPLHEGSVGQSAYVDPLLTISPQPILTGMSFYSGDLYPNYAGDLFMCQWLQGEVRRLELNASGTAVLSNNAFSQHIHSFDIDSGPDGNLWILHGQSLQGGSEVGRYVHVSTPATTTEIAPVSGPALGGSVTIGVRAPANRLVVPWLSFSTFPTPVPTVFGILTVVPDVPLAAKSSGPNGSAYYGIPLPNVPSFVGTQLWSQSISLDVFTLSSQMSNVSETILR
ncbi:MAG: sorbosone dehydrogenase family protein, partial [Planctomycetota bacterium]